MYERVHPNWLRSTNQIDPSLALSNKTSWVADLCVPESTDGFVQPVSRSSPAFVVLKQRREEEKERHCSVDNTLVRDVDVGELFVHRLVQRYYCYDVDV